jgi:hypothetical protein
VLKKRFVVEDYSQVGHGFHGVNDLTGIAAVFHQLVRRACFTERENAIYNCTNLTLAPQTSSLRATPALEPINDPSKVR